MMDTDLTRADLANVLRDVVENPDALAAITDETRFLEDLGMDSISLVALVFLCEERFEVSVSEGALEGVDLRTVGQVVSFMNQFKSRMAACEP
jgi:acyl carrier protein